MIIIFERLWLQLPRFKHYSYLKILQKIDRHIDYLPDVVSSRCLKMILMFLYSANLHVCNNLKLFIAAYTTEKMRV